MNILPLPRSPLFLSAEGRCIPGLTAGRSSELGVSISEALAEVEIEFAALEQSLQIQEELLKIRLQRGCFAALAERAPAAVLSRAAGETPALPGEFDFPAVGSDSVHLLDGPSIGCSHLDEPAVTQSPVLISEARMTAGSTQSKTGESDRRASIKIFPVAPGALLPKVQPASPSGTFHDLPIASQQQLRRDSNERQGDGASGRAPFNVFPKGRWSR